MVVGASSSSNNNIAVMPRPQEVMRSNNNSSKCERRCMCELGNDACAKMSKAFQVMKDLRGYFVQLPKGDGDGSSSIIGSSYSTLGGGGSSTITAGTAAAIRQAYCRHLCPSHQQPVKENEDTFVAVHHFHPKLIDSYFDTTTGTTTGTTDAGTASINSPTSEASDDILPFPTKQMFALQQDAKAMNLNVTVSENEVNDKTSYSSYSSSEYLIVPDYKFSQAQMDLKEAMQKHLDNMKAMYQMKRQEREKRRQQLKTALDQSKRKSSIWKQQKKNSETILLVERPAHGPAPAPTIPMPMPMPIACTNKPQRMEYYGEQQIPIQTAQQDVPPIPEQERAQTQTEARGPPSKTLMEAAAMSASNRSIEAAVKTRKRVGATATATTAKSQCTTSTFSIAVFYALIALVAIASTTKLNKLRLVDHSSLLLRPLHQVDNNVDHVQNRSRSSNEETLPTAAADRFTKSFDSFDDPTTNTSWWSYFNYFTKSSFSKNSSSTTGVDNNGDNKQNLEELESEALITIVETNNEDARSRRGIVGQDDDDTSRSCATMAMPPRTKGSSGAELNNIDLDTLAPTEIPSKVPVWSWKQYWSGAFKRNHGDSSVSSGGDVVYSTDAEVNSTGEIEQTLAGDNVPNINLDEKHNLDKEITNITTTTNSAQQADDDQVVVAANGQPNFDLVEKEVEMNETSLGMSINSEPKSITSLLWQKFVGSSSSRPSRVDHDVDDNNNNYNDNTKVGKDLLSKEVSASADDATNKVHADPVSDSDEDTRRLEEEDLAVSQMGGLSISMIADDVVEEKIFGNGGSSTRDITNTDEVIKTRSLSESLSVSLASLKNYWYGLVPLAGEKAAEAGIHKSGVDIEKLVDAEEFNISLVDEDDSDRLVLPVKDHQEARIEEGRDDDFVQPDVHTTISNSIGLESEEAEAAIEATATDDILAYKYLSKPTKLLVAWYSSGFALESVFLVGGLYFYWHSLSKPKPFRTQV